MRFMQPVACMILVVSTAHPLAAADFGLENFDLRGGVAMPSDWDRGISFGVSAEIARLLPGLYLSPGIRYSRAEDSTSFFGISIDTEITDLAVGAEVRYFLSKQPKGWYFGGGVYAHKLDYETAVLGLRVDRDEIRIGPAGVGGYRWLPSDTSRFAIFAEGRYDQADVFDRGEILLGVSF